MSRTFRTRASLLLLVFLSTLITGLVAANPSPATTQTVTAAAGTGKIFLPMIAEFSPATQSVFGVEVTRGGVPHIGKRAAEANVAWTRYNGIVWSEVEVNEGAPDFSKISSVDAELLELVRQGVRPIVIVRGTPAWAQQRPEYSCGAVKPDKLPAFARFMQQVVARYSAPPFNIEYFEMGNEVDVDPIQVGKDSQFGCWGDFNDPYFGGGKYGEMLNAVYPAVKQINPAVKIVFGGLLLDCDVTIDSNNCKPATFLEGALRAGAGSSFDVMAYHAYTFWSDSMPAHDWDLYDKKWGHRGGKMLGKLNFVREVMNKYQVNKPVMMNEGGLLCEWHVTCTENLRAVQSNYAVRLYTRSYAHNLVASIWYTLDYPGWYNGALMDQNGGTRPAYETIKFMATRLAGGQFAGTLSSGQLEAHVIRNGNKTYRVYWTNDGSTVPVAVPPGAVYNMYGQPITYNGTVGFEPIFVESDS